MAAGALRLELGADGAQVDTASAGTLAHDGQPATPEAIAVAGANGIDLSGHRARRLTPEAVRRADLVLVMDRMHLGAVRAMGVDPAVLHVLSEWPEPGEPGLPVADPYGASREAYEECWRRIRHHVKRAVPRIREALRARSM